MLVDKDKQAIITPIILKYSTVFMTRKVINLSLKENLLYLIKVIYLSQ